MFTAKNRDGILKAAACASNEKRPVATPRPVIVQPKKAASTTTYRHESESHAAVAPGNAGFIGEQNIYTDEAFEFLPATEFPILRADPEMKGDLLAVGVTTVERMTAKLQYNVRTRELYAQITMSAGVYSIYRVSLYNSKLNTKVNLDFNNTLVGSQKESFRNVMVNLYEYDDTTPATPGLRYTFGVPVIFHMVLNVQQHVQLLDALISNSLGFKIDQRSGTSTLLNEATEEEFRVYTARDGVLSSLVNFLGEGTSRGQILADLFNFSGEYRPIPASGIAPLRRTIGAIPLYIEGTNEQSQYIMLQEGPRILWYRLNMRQTIRFGDGVTPITLNASAGSIRTKFIALTKEQMESLIIGNASMSSPDDVGAAPTKIILSGVRYHGALKPRDPTTNPDDSGEYWLTFRGNNNPDAQGVGGVVHRGSMYWVIKHSLDPGTDPTVKRVAVASHLHEIDGTDLTEGNYFAPLALDAKSVKSPIVGSLSMFKTDTGLQYNTPFYFNRILETPSDGRAPYYRGSLYVNLHSNTPAADLARGAIRTDHIIEEEVPS